MFETLRTLVGTILFSPTALWTSREEVMLETSVVSVGEIKDESIFIEGRNSKNFFLKKNKCLIEDWISSAVIEKLFLEALATAVGSARVALLSMIALDVWFGSFSEMMFFIPFQVLSRLLV